mmetsp:Transcript_1189/g.2623  ORF Transcript_1189/g.2623 Transcript_1189/m.2623 type:complete len:213 (-) Transcript_1189:122-760(-)
MCRGGDEQFGSRGCGDTRCEANFQLTESALKPEQVRCPQKAQAGGKVRGHRQRGVGVHVRKDFPELCLLNFREVDILIVLFLEGPTEESPEVRRAFGKNGPMRVNGHAAGTRADETICELCVSQNCHHVCCEGRFGACRGEKSEGVMNGEQVTIPHRKGVKCVERIAGSTAVDQSQGIRDEVVQAGIFFDDCVDRDLGVETERTLGPLRHTL